MLTLKSMTRKIIEDLYFVFFSSIAWIGFFSVSTLIIFYVFSNFIENKKIAVLINSIEIYRGTTACVDVDFVGDKTEVYIRKRPFCLFTEKRYLVDDASIYSVEVM